MNKFHEAWSVATENGYEEGVLKWLDEVNGPLRHVPKGDAEYPCFELQDCNPVTAYDPKAYKENTCVMISGGLKSDQIKNIH